MQAALLARHPAGKEMLISTIQQLLTLFRERQLPVIFIRHDGGRGDELEQGSDGWQIAQEVAPLAEEKIVDKRFNSAFRQTGLRDYLEVGGIRRLILCGMQTEYCVDVTCKVAFEYGYSVSIPRGGTATFDNEFSEGCALTAYYEEQIWHGRYAQVMDLPQLLAEISIPDGQE